MNGLRARWLAFGVLASLPGILAAWWLAARLAADAAVADERALDAGVRVADRLLRARELWLVEAAGALAADPAVRDALVGGDPSGVRAALDRRPRSVASAVLVVVDEAGRSVPDPPGTAGEGLAAAIGRDVIARPEPTLLLDDTGRVWQTASVPVRAPLVVGRVTVGLPVDEELARELAGISGLEVMFVAGPAAEPWWRASSLDPGVADAVIEHLGRDVRERGGWSAGELALPSGARSVRVRTLPGFPGGRLALVAPPRPPFAVTAGRLALGVGAAVALLTAIGWAWTTRRVVTPLAALATAAETVAAGEEPTLPDVPGSDEIARLATGTAAMLRAVRAREEAVRKEALHDPLTGLPIRALLLERLGEAIGAAMERGSSLAVILVDLGRFKDVNEALGQRAGDEVLRAAADRLLQALRTVDLVARVGADEFAIVLPDTDAVRALRVAEKIVGEIEEPFGVADLRVEMTARLGVATCPEHGDEPETLLQHAGTALRQAKAAQHGVVVYRPRGEAARPGRLALAGELRRAVAGSELLLHYQPKVELASGRLRQVEALVRWQHPERGFLPPAEFVPLAEETGHIRLVTRWTLEEAVRQAAEWAGKGLSFGVAVNLSALDLLDSDLARSVYRPLMRYGLPPSRLVVEITETAMMRETAQLVALVEELREIGVRVAIDDFGTGYSSLSLLRRLAVHEIKIDKSFVTHMLDRPDDQVLVRSTIELGHNLGLEVVAEGIETEACRTRLRELGCDLAQGFAIGRPMPPLELASWLAGVGQASGRRGARGTQ